MNSKKQNEPDMDFSKKKLNKVVDYAADLIQGKPLYESQNIPKRTIDTIYVLAMDSYSSGQYDNSCKLFQLLCLYDHTNPYNFLGFGSCMQMLDKIPQACSAYNIAIRLNPYSYNSHFNLSQCLIKAGKVDDAIISLKNVMFIGKKQPEIQKKDVYIKAKQMLEMLTNSD